jgi:hypothetical protein
LNKIAASTEYGSKTMEEKVRTEEMFQSTELGILVKDHELREFYNLAELPISLPELAILHHRTCFGVGGRRHILKMAVANAELQKILSHALEHGDPKDPQGQYLHSTLAWLLLMNTEVKVCVDDRGRPKLSGQHFKFYYFGDLLIMDDYLRIGLGKHEGAVQYWLEIEHTQFQKAARLVDAVDAKSFPTRTNWFQDRGSSATPYQRAPMRLSSSRSTTTFIDLSEVQNIEF